VNLINTEEGSIISTQENTMATRVYPNSGDAGTIRSNTGGSALVVSDTDASTLIHYPKELWKSWSSAMDPEEMKNFYCAGRLYHGLPPGELRGPSAEEATRFYKKMTGIRKRVLCFTKNKIVEEVVAWSKKNLLKMKVGTSVTMQSAASLGDVVAILTDHEEYNKLDNRTKCLLFEVQYEIWGSQYWTKLEKEFCNEEGIELVAAGGKSLTMGSIGCIMSEKKTWIAQYFQQACNRKLGSFVGKREPGRNSKKKILETLRHDTTNKKMVVYATTKATIPPSEDASTGRPGSIAATKDVGSLIATGVITKEQMIAYLSQNSIPIDIRPPSAVEINEGTPYSRGSLSSLTGTGTPAHREWASLTFPDNGSQRQHATPESNSGGLPSSNVENQNRIVGNGENIGENKDDSSDDGNQDDEFHERMEKDVMHLLDKGAHKEPTQEEEVITVSGAAAAAPWSTPPAALGLQPQQVTAPTYEGCCHEALSLVDMEGPNSYFAEKYLKDNQNAFRECAGCKKPFGTTGIRVTSKKPVRVCPNAKLADHPCMHAYCIACSGEKEDKTAIESRAGIVGDRSRVSARNVGRNKRKHCHDNRRSANQE
jgi:hypothetical protein